MVCQVCNYLLEPGAGFNVDDFANSITITPSAVGLHMYVRCQGSRESPIAFFKLTAPPDYLSKREAKSWEKEQVIPETATQN